MGFESIKYDNKSKYNYISKDNNNTFDKNIYQRGYKKNFLKSKII